MKRKHLRAPLKTEFLYVSDDYVLKGVVQNISEGGILLGELPQIPPVKAMHVLVEIPLYPDFQKMSSDRILSLTPESIGKKIRRMRAKIVRSFEGQSEVDKAFVTNIGCQFVDPSAELIGEIKDYVSLFARNTIYLLQLFESMGRSKTQLEVMRQVSILMGYRQTEKVAVLRQKVLHDYQSLESL